MRVVLLGKGGSGKSSLAGLLCAELAAAGDEVVAVDADTVPGLATVLGVEPTDAWFLDGMAQRHNGGWQLAASPEEIVDRCARTGPDGVRFVQMGNADAGLGAYEMAREQHVERWAGMVAFNTVARSYDQAGGWVVVDLQGGTTNVASGLAGRSGIAVMVVEPFAKSLLTARRFIEMGAWPEGVRLVAVANKITGDADRAYVESELARFDMPLLAAIPRDPSIRDVERSGRGLGAMDAAAPARQALAGLATRLRGVAAEMAASPADV